MAKEKKQLPEDKKVARRRIYATERLRHLTEELKTLKATLDVERKAAPKEPKAEGSNVTRRAHIYQVMRLQILKDERAGLREELKSRPGSKAQAEA